MWAARGIFTIFLAGVIAQPFRGTWNTIVIIAVCLVGTSGYELYSAKLRRHRKELEARVEEACDNFLLNVEAVLLSAERCVAQIQAVNVCTEDNVRLFNLFRRMGRLEGAISAYHHIAQAGFDTSFMLALMEPVNHKMHEVLEAIEPFQPEEKK